MRILVLILSLLLATVAWADPSTSVVSAPDGPAILAKLKPGHPRLLADAARFAELRKTVDQDPHLKAWHEKLKEAGTKMLAAPVSTYEIPDGLRLLATSRKVLERVYTLGMLYQLDQDPKWATRAWAELDAASKFPDWNPQRHFLDTAEMTHAFAIGLDWMWDAWTPEQREQLRKAIVDKGLAAGIKAYAGDKAISHFWIDADHNWNQVCNGGLSVGALAVADTDPQIAGEILHYALERLPKAIKQYGPDGAWPEGPGYWQYATTYTVACMAAMDSALGTDFGLSEIPGFEKSGMPVIYTTSPSKRTFNYSDTGPGNTPVHAPEMFWLASRYGRDEYAWYQVENALGSPLDILWYKPGGPGTGLTAPKSLPLDFYFRHTEIVSMRTSWTDPDATMVSFKAGNNKANHSHLDLGSFVLDAIGKRWAIDLGSDDYNLPGYFGGQRWTYYRLRAEGHNTLVINPGTGPDQDPKAACPIASFKEGAEGTTTSCDLTAAYTTQAHPPKSVVRTIERMAGGEVRIVDEIQASAASEVWWFMHTQAAVVVNGNAATLTIGKSKMVAKIVSPADAVFTVMESTPLPSSPHPAKQNANEKIRKLAIHLMGVERVKIEVVLTPVVGDGATGPAK